MLRTLISKEYAATRRKEIDAAKRVAGLQGRPMTGATPSARVETDQNFTGRDRGDTIYLTAADGKGNFVSLIQSLFSDFGSGIVAGDTGILLHNRGSRFNLNAGHPDQIAPHKRPLHTLIPAFVMKDGKPCFSLRGHGRRSSGAGTHAGAGRT